MFAWFRRIWSRFTRCGKTAKADRPGGNGETPDGGFFFTVLEKQKYAFPGETIPDD